MEVFLRSHCFRPCIFLCVLFGLSLAVTEHKADGQTRQRMREVASAGRSERPVRGQVNKDGVYIAERRAGVESEGRSGTSADEEVKVRRAPSVVRREVQLDKDQDTSPLHEPLPATEASSLIEAHATETAGSDEAFNWWDSRRRRRRFNCVWMEWEGWTPCSKECGTGSKSRERKTYGPMSGGEPCEGPREEFLTCNTHNCAVDCEVDAWGPWGPCSELCGHGKKERTRGPKAHTNLDGGKPCPVEILLESSPCKVEDCQPGCVFGQWGSYGPCTKTCGTGTKTRNRGRISGSCLSSYYVDKQECNAFNCPIDCRWTQWGSFGECSKTCGGGLKIREREYDPMQINGGVVCPGSAADLLACNLHDCPVDCLWGEWSKPSPCTKTCGGGTFRRHRAKIQEMANMGKTCEGQPSSQVGSCNAEPCPVDCIYGEWKAWGACSGSCGGGVRTANRTNKEAQYGGIKCRPQAKIREESCQMQECPVLIVKEHAHRQAVFPRTVLLLVAIASPALLMQAPF